MNGAALPSLGVIAAIGAHRSGALVAARKLVIITSVPRSNGGTDAAVSSGMVPDKTADVGSIAKWAGGVTGLAAVGFAFGDGKLGDVAGAFLALTAFALSITYGSDLITAVTNPQSASSVTPAPTIPGFTAPGAPPNTNTPGFWGSFGVGTPPPSQSPPTTLPGSGLLGGSQ